MKRLLTALLLITALTAPARADEDGFVTGKDWVEYMSEREKFMSLIPPALVFSDYDVRLRLGLPQYILLIDRVLRLNPQLEGEDIENIFASTVYFFEPQNREALRTMELNFLKGEIETKPYHIPRLTIEEVLNEIADQSQEPS